MKFIKVFAFFLLLNACSSSPEQSFKGKEYQLMQAQNDVKVTLAFDTEGANFFGRVVNNYFGTYDVDGSKITLNLGGSTMMMGPEEETEAEQNFFQILPKVKSYKFSENTLILITDNGQELAFKEIAPFDSKKGK